jgi:CheY-like chemotaxis protein
MMRPTVLIVEDDIDIQDYLAIILEGLDMELVRAGNGEEALAVIDSGRPINLILLDVIMPVMDGEEFLRRLRLDRKSGVPVILTSVDEAIAARLRAIGEIQGVFLKGGRGEDLKALIASKLNPG